MVALLSPTHFEESAPASEQRRRHLAVVDAAPTVVQRPAVFQEPTVVQGPAAFQEPAAVLPLRPAVAGSDPVRLEVLALAAFFGLAVIVGLAFSLLQSAPPAETWAEVQSAAVGAGAVPTAGESTLIVAPGDTLWALAAELAPDADRRQVVALLERRNGGAGLQAGQLLIIPAGLAPVSSGDLASP